MDDDQQFCLRWNNHQSTLVSVFDTLLESGTLVDCTLAAEGKSLKAHKVVLSACSPYFASLLEQQYDKHPIFILKDVKFQELRAMMDYMYRGEVNISQDQLSPLLKAAESLQIKGLSDNRSAGSPHKPQQQQQQTNEHKQLSVPVAAAAAGVGGGIKLPISSGYTLESKRIRHAGGIVGGVGGGSASIDSQDLSGSREGSSSPTSRKRKKIRRRSVENIMAEAHEHSNSSSHSMQINSSAPTITSAAAAIASVSSTNAATSSLSTSSTAAATLAGGNIIASAGGGLSVTKKTESVSNAKLIGGNIERDIDNDDDNRDENGKSAVVQSANTIGGGKKEQNHKQRKLHHQHQDTGDATGKDNTEMLIEPKNEYDDGNDETVEDLTLDDEELEDLEQAGPSHGGGEGSSQGYAQWQVDRSQDEIFIATQEAAGQQRDPQVKHDKSEQTDITPEEFELDDCLLESNDIVITQNKDGFVLHVKKLGNITTSKIASVDGQPTAHEVGEHQHVELTAEGPLDTKPTLTSLATCQIKLPSSECELINLKKVSQPSTSAGQAIATATIIQPSQVQEHASIVAANQETINSLLALREVNIQPKDLESCIKYSRGKFSSPTPQSSATALPATVQVGEKKYEIAEIDLNNPQASASIISDLVKYAEIDDIELPDGTKIGIGFAPAEISEHIQATAHQQQQQHVHIATETHSAQPPSQTSQSPVRQQEQHESPITKSYTILTTTPIKQQQQQTATYELSISDNSMSQSEDNEKLFVCRHCGRKYRWKSTLRRHENVECGGKEPCHPCPYCSYKAKQRGNLGVHVRKHHPDKPQLESKRGRRPT